jgi:hypothetical protein
VQSYFDFLKFTLFINISILKKVSEILGCDHVVLRYKPTRKQMLAEGVEFTQDGELNHAWKGGVSYDMKAYQKARREKFQAMGLSSGGKPRQRAPYKAKPPPISHWAQ